MTERCKLSESSVKDGLSSPASPPANHPVPLSGNHFTRHEAAKGHRATCNSLPQSNSQHTPPHTKNTATEAGTDDDESLSSPNTVDTSSIRTMAETTAQIGTDSPIKNFRPMLWKHLDTKTHSLALDLFWPVKTGDEDDGVYVDRPVDEHDDVIAEDACLPLAGLKPMLSFRNLTALHLTGMMRSYQPLIWEVVWSNAGLVILDLEMAFEPIFNPDPKHPNRIIDPKWQVFPTIEASSSNTTVDTTASKDPGDAYLGTDGTGVLDPTYGDGEYLDSLAITHAQKAAANASTLPVSNLRYLPIRILRLQNIVIDGIAIKRWFNPKTLKSIVFKPGCIDAGFYLGPDMAKSVKLTPPKATFYAAGNGFATSAALLAKPRLQLVELSKGTVVARGPFAVDAKSALAAAAAAAADNAATSPFVALGRLSRTFSRAFSLGKDKENKKDAVAPAAAEAFVHVDHPVPVPARAPSASLGCFGGVGAAAVADDDDDDDVEEEEDAGGGEFYTEDEVAEAKKGKKKAAAAAE